MVFIRYKGSSDTKYYQIVRNRRVGGKHFQEVLFHLGKNSSIEEYIERKTEEVTKLQNQASELFKDATRRKTEIIALYGERLHLDGKIPSLETATETIEQARRLRDESSDFQWPQRHRTLMQAHDLKGDIREYHRVNERAGLYVDEANEQQQKIDKLLELKQRYSL